MGVLQMVQTVHSIRPLSRGSIQVALDGLSTLRQAEGKGPVDPTYPSSDIINAIRQLNNDCLLKLYSGGLRVTKTRDMGNRTIGGNLTSSAMPLPKGFGKKQGFRWKH